MGNCIKRKILEAQKYLFLLIHIIDKLKVLLCQSLRCWFMCQGLMSGLIQILLKPITKISIFIKVHILSKIVCIQLKVQSKCV